MALGLVVAARLWVICGYPVGVDQGVFGWFGRIVADGGRPYVDAWDTKGPGVFALSGFVESVMPGPVGMRLFDIVLQLAAACVLWRFPVCAPAPLTGLLAASMYMAAYTTLGFHETAQPDSWANAILVMGLVPLLSAEIPLDSSLMRRRLFWACASVSVAVLFKPTYGALGAVPLAVLIAETRRNADGLREGALPRALVAAAMGFLAPLLLCAGWLASKGALGAMWDVVIRWNSAVYAREGASDLRHMAYSAVHAYFENLRWWPLALVSGVALVGSLRARRAPVMALWTAMVVVEIAAQRKFWGYHWTPLIGPLAVAVSNAARDAVRDAVGHSIATSRMAIRHSLATVGAIGIALSVAAAVLWSERARLGEGRGTAASAMQLLGYANRLSGFDDVVRVVRRDTKPSDRVYFWGTLAIGNYLTDRATVGRLAVSRPLLDGAGTAVNAEYRAEFWRAWQVKPPAMVVAYSATHCERYPELEWTCLEAFPELGLVLGREYRRPMELGGFVVYYRR